MGRRAGAVLVTALLVAACGTSGHHVPPGLRAAYSDAVEHGRHLRVPSMGDVGLDRIDAAAAQRELAALSGRLSDTDPKAALGAACRAKTRYESGAAKTQDAAVSQALAERGLHLDVQLIAELEQRIVRDAESSNPALAAAAVFACQWAKDD